MKQYFLFCLFPFIGFYFVSAQQQLSVEKIMQDPQWIGTFPTNVTWSEDGQTIYFEYNPEQNPGDSLYKVETKDLSRIRKVDLKEQQQRIPRQGSYNSARTEKLYIKNGDLWNYNLETGIRQELVDLSEGIEDPQFLADESLLIFQAENNAFLFDRKKGQLKQLTRIRKGKEKEEKEKELTGKEQWVQTENLDLLEVVHQRKENKERSEKYQKATTPKEAFVFYLGDKSLSELEISPDAKYATFNLISREKDKRTQVPNYVDKSGYTVNLPARSKVGEEGTTVELAIYNFEKDSVYLVSTEGIPGIDDLPDYTEDYPERKWPKTARAVIPSKVFFSGDGKQAVVSLRSKDNKDRWIAAVDLDAGTLHSLDRQRDEAWIAGPGIGHTYSPGTLGWMPDNEHIFFQSEASGYSHLYLLQVSNGRIKALTKGAFEVFDPFLSYDENYWYFTTSKEHTGERHFYRMPAKGGRMEKLTELEGNNQVYLSPDEEKMAILHSYSNQPWELYFKETRTKSKAIPITEGTSEEFAAYPWRDPQLINFPARDGAIVPARLYTPDPEKKNHAAIVFVHGAGYLQNAHKWWSSYFREYMFHNLLADLGYTVIDIDYRGSAGYGRDWRTGIYRHMGGKDLSDQVDGVNFLVENHGINPDKVGIYGGSYGGFITLMAMFNEPETFKAGAALRSVTDWAHYNNGYTSNILNEPSLDPVAYRRSSPIYFAEGLKGNLLIAHGMVDVNVHFQDVVRLSQRLIELGKENWELAVYPVEDHGFAEPSSWTDEYKRILKLFNETLLD